MDPFLEDELLTRENRAFAQNNRAP